LSEDTLEYEADAGTYEFGLSVLTSDTRTIMLAIATFLNTEVQMNRKVLFDELEPNKSPRSITLPNTRNA
jgi:hypothetical protein